MTIEQGPSFDPKSFLAKVGEGRSVGRYSKDRIVFTQGDPADSVFYIQKGKVKVTVISEHGKEAVVALLGPDEFCGEGCLAGQPRRIGTAIKLLTSLALFREPCEREFSNAPPNRIGMIRQIWSSEVSPRCTKTFIGN
jgi:CRP-like cAMP-binding protein